MPVGAINRENGADLLRLVSQSAGRPASVQTTATMDAIKVAVAMVQLSNEDLIGGNSTPMDTGTLLNVFA